MAGRGQDSEIIRAFVGLLLRDDAADPVYGEHPRDEFSRPSPATPREAGRAYSQPLRSSKMEVAQSLLKAMPQFDPEDGSRSRVDFAQAEVKLHPQILVPEQPASPGQIHAGSVARTDIEEAEPLPKDAAATAAPVTDTDRAVAGEIVYDYQLDLNADGVPCWAEGEFQTLIFRLGKLKLAVPLVKLGGIHRLSDQLTSIAGRPEWYLGLMPDDLGNISVLDTALWIMPEKYQAAKAAGLEYNFFVLLDDSRWGLACTRVENSITLKSDDVHWSQAKRRRPWLSGMLVDQMCALLDVDALIGMLNAAQRQASQDRTPNSL